jgi:hypothetical protein
MPSTYDHSNKGVCKEDAEEDRDVPLVPEFADANLPKPDLVKDHIASNVTSG